MDDIRKSLSRTKKKIKDRLKGKGRKVDRTGVDTGEEASSTSSFPQPDPHVVVGSSQNREARGVDVEGRESSRSNLHPDAEVAGKSGPSQEGNDANGKGPDRVDPPPSMALIPRSDGMWRGPIQSLPLIVSLDNADDPAAPDQVQEALSPNQSEPNAAGENKWKTASATTKMLLRGVKESADAFPPLKSVAGGLYFILENWEVRPYFHTHYSQSLQVPQQTKANEKAIESLADRVNTLSASLCTPVSEGDKREESRRKELGG